MNEFNQLVHFYFKINLSQILKFYGRKLIALLSSSTNIKTKHCYYKEWLFQLCALIVLSRVNIKPRVYLARCYNSNFLIS